MSDGGEVKHHLRGRNVLISECTLPADQKVILASKHLTIGMHIGPPVLLSWRQAPSPIRKRRVHRGMVHVLGADIPVWMRSCAPTDILVVSLDSHLVTDISVENGNAAVDIGVAIAVIDWKIRSLASLFEREFRDGGSNGHLYLEGLATALAVHLLRHYGQMRRTPGLARGGIAPARLRRVLEYMDQHLTENIPLANLATLSGLAFHHFAHAFKDSMGVSPHRFLIERRVARARLLLADSHLSVAEVALMLGFADQSHFTEHFRRLTGITPARYRRNL